MVYMHFPKDLTEEEELLLKKYAKLRKKKQALKALRTPKAEPAQPAEEAKKRSYERAADATEEAKKLLKSGLLKLGDKKGQREFKRTKRQKDSDRSAVGFQPFQASQGSDHEDEQPESAATTGTPGSGSGRKKVKNLYDSFISSREPKLDPDDDRSGGSDRDERGARDRSPRDREPRSRDNRLHRRDRRDSDREPPKKGNTIYIHGHDITEDLIKKTFSNFGTLVNISMEPEKNCGFVTFEKMESADEAISVMNGSMMSGVQLKVSMARRQPAFNIEQAADPSSATWAAIAVSQSQKGTHRDKRELVIYDDDIF